MAERIRRAFDAIARRLSKRARLEDLEGSELTAKEVISNPYNTIFLGALKNGYAWLSHKPRGPWPINDYRLALYTQSHRCVEIDGTDYQACLRASRRALAREIRPAAASQKELRVGIIFDRWIGNYYHWMVFGVPKLILLREVFGVDRFYMPSDLYKIPCFVWQTLELLGLPQEALIPISSGIHSAPELCFVHGAGPTPFTCGLTRRRLVSPGSGGPPPERRKVFLLRQANTHARRALVNEGDVLSLCAQMGIEPVDPGALPLREQIALFREVELVVAVHGAALANMLWMPPGGKVIEIATGSQPHYRALAENLGLTWMSLLARKADPTDAGYNGEFIVNTEILEKVIQV